jgi:hypothetical protein
MNVETRTLMRLNDSDRMLADPRQDVRGTRSWTATVTRSARSTIC